LGAVGDTESAATEDGFDDVFAVMQLLSGGQCLMVGGEDVGMMVLIVAETGEFLLRAFVGC
jgi:hypothetical protein